MKKIRKIIEKIRLKITINGVRFFSPIALGKLDENVASPIITVQSILLQFFLKPDTNEKIRKIIEN
jgi:hypothetical protein